MNFIIFKIHKILRLNLNTKYIRFFFKGIQIQNSILYFKYMFEILPIPASDAVQLNNRTL